MGREARGQLGGKDISREGRKAKNETRRNDVVRQRAVLSMFKVFSQSEKLTDSYWELVSPAGHLNENSFLNVNDQNFDFFY